MSLMTGILLKLPSTIFKYLFDISHESVNYRSTIFTYLNNDSSLLYMVLYYRNILIYFTNSYTTNFKSKYGKYGTSILIYRRSYTGQYFGELLFEKFLMVTK